MTLSRQERSLESGRSNQKARTRKALLEAAMELVRDGAEPSVPAAAERAMISVATAYRYFSSAEDLWWEAAAAAAADHTGMLETTALRVTEAGPDPQARLEAVIRTTNFQMVEDPAPYRRLAKHALEQWLRQEADPPAHKVPVRQGRRREQLELVVGPLKGELPAKDLARLTNALGIVVGIEAMISLVDAMDLDERRTKTAMLDAARWMLAGALAELEG